MMGGQAQGGIQTRSGARMTTRNRRRRAGALRALPARAAAGFSAAQRALFAASAEICAGPRLGVHGGGEHVAVGHAGAVLLAQVALQRDQVDRRQRRARPALHDRLALQHAAAQRLREAARRRAQHALQELHHAAARGGRRVSGPPSGHCRLYFQRPRAGATRCRAGQRTREAATTGASALPPVKQGAGRAPGGEAEPGRLLHQRVLVQVVLHHELPARKRRM